MKQFRTTWGLVGPSMPWMNLSKFIEDAARADFQGVEFPLAHLAFEHPDEAEAISRVLAKLEETELQLIALIATRPENWGDEAGHLEDFKRQVSLAQRLGAQKAAVHCGADSFDHATSVRFLRDVHLLAADHGVLPCIETHRGRPLFNPWSTAALLDALPDMRLTSDLSHWHVVVDRDPIDIMDLFDEASRRASHVHARIGHEKGPQVPHPGDQFWKDHVALYKRWWTISKESMDARGETFTIASEFGPPPYMNTRPFSHEPDCDLVQLNSWMQGRLTDWFGS